ncbi:uncharacterized protein C8orf59 homolog [Scleropages formosus]|uniref:uncharacterized protein C8orf59 homolog n=1 Tax=Scleropages formosus TaxID=113540 RepID=UPI000878BCC2|nr:uncharacterized protein C8orf59 homolog [Scleropages formosus]XP_018596618.1 uncharacterized protein C8orf59 homolog [Scleropages formosus]XP_018596619.1 uncharacterized protein C8orf59 homolog [Scleropages formosus]
MAKNKQKGQKQKNVFQVANKMKIAKNKNKAKPVTTHLKRISAVKNEKVDSLNKTFTAIQREVKSVSRCTAPKEVRKTPQVAREPAREPVNVDNAAQLLSQL